MCTGTSVLLLPTGDVLGSGRCPMFERCSRRACNIGVDARAEPRHSGSADVSCSECCHDSSDNIGEAMFPVPLAVARQLSSLLYRTR